MQRNKDKKKKSVLFGGLSGKRSDLQLKRNSFQTIVSALCVYGIALHCVTPTVRFSMCRRGKTSDGQNTFSERERKIQHSRHTHTTQINLFKRPFEILHLFFLYKLKV